MGKKGPGTRLGASPRARGSATAEAPAAPPQARAGTALRGWADALTDVRAAPCWQAAWLPTCSGPGKTGCSSSPSYLGAQRGGGGAVWEAQRWTGGFTGTEPNGRGLPRVCIRPQHTTGERPAEGGSGPKGPKPQRGRQRPQRRPPCTHLHRITRRRAHDTLGVSAAYAGPVGRRGAVSGRGQSSDATLQRHSNARVPSWDVLCGWGPRRMHHIMRLGCPSIHHDWSMGCHPQSMRAARVRSNHARAVASGAHAGGPHAKHQGAPLWRPECAACS